MGGTHHPITSGTLRAAFDTRGGDGLLRAVGEGHRLGRTEVGVGQLRLGQAGRGRLGLQWACAQDQAAQRQKRQQYGRGHHEMGKTV